MAYYQDFNHDDDLVNFPIHFVIMVVLSQVCSEQGSLTLSTLACTWCTCMISNHLIIEAYESLLAVVKSITTLNISIGYAV